MSRVVELDSRAEHDFYTSFGERVRAARRASNLSQEALAGHVGLTRSSIANLESGRQHPPVYILALLADALSIPESDLLPVRQERSGLDPKPLEARLKNLDEHKQHMIRSTARAAGLTMSDA